MKGTNAEKVFWTIKLLVVISTAVYMSHTYFVKFFTHEVDSNLAYQPQTKMELPLVFVCGNTMKEMLGSQCNCNSTASKSYDKTVCESLQQKCPHFCRDRDSGQECSATLVAQGVSCDERLLGQCILLNGDSDMTQTLNNPGMKYKIQMNRTDFPLWVLVKPPGQVELMPTPGIEMKWTEIYRGGNYHFSVEETQVNRLPLPYNKMKRCVHVDSVEARDNNMFLGDKLATVFLFLSFLPSLFQCSKKLPHRLKIQIIGKAGSLTKVTPL